MFVFFFKQKTTNELRISDWSSDVCSSDLLHISPVGRLQLGGAAQVVEGAIAVAQPLAPARPLGKDARAVRREAQCLVAVGHRPGVVLDLAVAARAVEVERRPALPADQRGIEVEHRIARLAELAVALATAGVRLPRAGIEGPLAGGVGDRADRKSVVLGKRVVVRVDIGGTRINKK